MEAWRRDLYDDRRTGSLRRGWRLARAAWRLLRADRSVLALALATAAFGCAVAVASLLIARSIGPGARSGDVLFVRFVAGAIYAIGSTLLLGALVCAVDAVVDRTPLATRDVLAEARGHLGPLLIWGFVSVCVSTAVQLAGRNGLSPLAAALALLAWLLATTFAIPALILRTSRVGDAVIESARTMGRRWRQALSGFVRIGLFVWLAAIPAGALMQAGVTEHRDDPDPSSGLALFVIGIGLISAVFAIGSATKHGFALLLYREATGDLPDVAPPPAPRPRRRLALRIAAAILAGLVVLVALAAVGHRDREPRTSADGYFWAAYSTGAEGVIDDGMPIWHRRHQVGHVVEHRLEDGRVIVVYYLEPGSRGLADKGELAFVTPQPGKTVLRFIRIRFRP